jgi:ZIP family zinc transporter
VFAGVVGAAAVLMVQAMLPYALSYAGAAMLFVIVRDMIPDVMGDEATRMGNTMIVMLSYAAMVVFESAINAATAA